MNMEFARRSFTSFRMTATFFLVAMLFLKTPLAQATRSSDFNSQTWLPKSKPLNTLEEKHWKWIFAPYIWAINMNGSVQMRTQRVPVSQDFNDLLKELNWAGMIWLEADRGRLGIFLNLLYASLSQDASDPFISAQLHTNLGLYSAGLSYEIYQACLCTQGCQSGDSSLHIVPYLGARYTSNDTNLTLSTPFGNLRTSNHQHWTDPLIGARFNFDLSKAWLLSFAGDIGGTNTTSDYSYNVWALIGYRPQTLIKYTAWYLGYRLLDQHYSKGNSSNYYLWDMKLFGPIAGVAFTF